MSVQLLHEVGLSNVFEFVGISCAEVGQDASQVGSVVLMAVLLTGQEVLQVLSDLALELGEAAQAVEEH